MKKWLYVPLALVLMGGVACDRNDRPATANDTGVAGTTGTSGTSDSDLGMDRGFVEDQLEDGDAEVRLGRLAQERASNPDVRAFAEMMVRDHSKAGEALKRIAARHNIRMEAAADHGSHHSVHERLSKLAGAEFDREYMDAMVTDHGKAVNALEDKAEDSKNSEVKQWAATTLPTVKQHLERAKMIQQNLRAGGTTRTPDTEVPTPTPNTGKKKY